MLQQLYRHACMPCKYALVDIDKLRLRCSKDASKHPYDYCPDTPCKSFAPQYVFDMRGAQKISVRKKGGKE